MNDEMFEELWKNGQLALTRMKTEGFDMPSHGRTRHVVKYAMEKLPLPEGVEWGGVMRFPVDMVERDNERQSIMANTINLGRTFEHDIKEEHPLLGCVRDAVTRYTKPTTLFIYMPPLPMKIDSAGSRGWSWRISARDGLGWLLVPPGSM